MRSPNVDTPDSDEQHHEVPDPGARPAGGRRIPAAARHAHVLLATLTEVSDAEQPSQRLVEQRLRNRTMEALDALGKGDDGVREVGAVEYVEQFFDVIDDNAPWRWQTWTCFTPHEVQALAEVQRLLRVACDATPETQSDDQFIG
jgi:hypothetical protein